MTTSIQSATKLQINNRLAPGKVFSIAVVTMVQLRDLPWALTSLKSLRQMTGDGLSRLVLVNDACDREIAELLAAASGGEVIVAGRNLGVAGGRNRLVREAAARGAKYVLSIDDDIVLPADFAEVLWREYNTLAEIGLAPGILTPATLDFHAVKKDVFCEEALAQIERGEEITVPSLDELRGLLRASAVFGANTIYHMGVRDWRGAYCFTNGRVDSEIREHYGIAPAQFPGAESALKEAAGAAAAILDAAEPIKIDTAPGGVSLYSVDLFERIGGVSEVFNPFGYEDADFALRAARLGYQHYCAPRAIAIHDIASRLTERPLPALMATQGKMAGAFCRRHLEGREAAAALLVIAQRVFVNIGIQASLSRDKGAAFPSLLRLSSLLAFCGNALLYGLPEEVGEEAPSPRELLADLSNRAQTLFPVTTQTTLQLVAPNSIEVSDENNHKLLKLFVEKAGDETMLRIAGARLSAPNGLTPPILRTLAGGGGLDVAVEGDIFLGPAGAFRIERLNIAVPGGFELSLSGSGSRMAAAPGALASLAIEALDLSIRDRGALARLLAYLCRIEGRKPADFVPRLRQAHKDPSLTPVFDWLTGASNKLAMRVCGALDGTPGELALRLCELRTPSDAAMNEEVVRLLQNNPAPPPKPGGRSAENATGAKNPVNKMMDALSRLASEDPRVAPFPDSYNPSAPTKFLRKLRYISASRGVPIYPNEARILRHKNAGRGRRAFIIGNGPSLNRLDLTKLKDEATFGVNAIYLNKDKMGFLPTHYIVEDVFVAEDRAAEINTLTGPTKWFGNYLKYCLTGGPDVCWLNVACDYREYQDFPHFSPNASRIVWVGGTVSYIALQIAYFMGYDPIYLIGFDHSYSVPTDAQVEGRAITSVSEDPNHFHPDYFGKGYRWHDPRVDRMETAYRKARSAYEAAGRNVFNATAGGKLEVFRRVEFDSLFEKAKA